MITKVIFIIMILAGALSARAQGVERVFVENYHAQRLTDGSTLNTYRIYVDLAPGHELQMVYGDERNQMEISTTTTFYNDTILGSKFGDRSIARNLNEGHAALDTWLTIGAATDEHWGVPLGSDTDGSILDPIFYPVLQDKDGLMKADVKEVVNFKMENGYLDRVRGSIIHTMDGAWAILGGTKGPTEKNIILIAQLSTTGELSYKLNLQTRTPDKQLVNYVSTNANEAEIFLPGLLYGRYSM